MSRTTLIPAAVIRIALIQIYSPCHLIFSLHFSIFYQTRCSLFVTFYQTCFSNLKLTYIHNIINSIQMKEQLVQYGKDDYYQHEEYKNIEEMLGRAGNSDRYQLRLLFLYFLIWLLAAFIQMGFPIIFHPAVFECPPGQPCDEETACKNNYPLSDKWMSVAYSFGLVCSEKSSLTMCFNAFLCGGFIGSLYYGFVMERRGRRYGLLESLIMMIGGIYISLVSGSVIVFSIGVFLFSAGFRGFYNASLLVLTETMSEVSRASTPMFLSIGWAFGQIIIALIGYWITNWRVLFLLTAIPMTFTFYYSYKYTLDSPRFLVVKQQYAEAKKVIEEIAKVNNNPLTKFQLAEEAEYNARIQGLKNIVGNEGQVRQRLRHHSYYSLYKFTSIRIRVLIVSYIWSIISLSYFISANSQINPDRSAAFNIALAGVIQIIAYMSSMLTSLNFDRITIIKKILIISGIVHVLYFFIGPLNSYHGFGKIFVMFQNILVRVLMSLANTFLAIYAIELFPTSIRHFSLGMLGFITKLMYWLSFSFNDFWSYREIHPNFILGFLFLGGWFLTPKLRETKEHHFKDNLSEDNEGNLMAITEANLF